jgi:hypothetical protein
MLFGSQNKVGHWIREVSQVYDEREGLGESIRSLYTLWSSARWLAAKVSACVIWIIPYEQLRRAWRGRARRANSVADVRYRADVA